MERTFIRVQLTKEEIEYLILSIQYDIDNAEFPQTIDEHLLTYFKSLIAGEPQA